MNTGKTARALLTAAQRLPKKIPASPAMTMHVDSTAALPRVVAVKTQASRRSFASATLPAQQERRKAADDLIALCKEADENGAKYGLWSAYDAIVAFAGAMEDYEQQFGKIPESPAGQDALADAVKSFKSTVMGSELPWSALPHRALDKLLDIAEKHDRSFHEVILTARNAKDALEESWQANAKVGHDLSPGEILEEELARPPFDIFAGRFNW